MKLIFCFIVALFLFGMQPRTVFAQDDVFAGWTPRKTDTGLTFEHNASDSFVAVMDLSKINAMDVNLAFKSTTSNMPQQCGDMTKTVTRSVEGGRRETFNVDQEWNCMVVVMPGNAGVISILAIDIPGSGADSKAVAYALIAKATAGGSQPASQSNTAQYNTKWPKGGLVSEAQAQIDWQAAWKMGLDPDDDLLPTRYECFNLGTRTPKPDADGLLIVNANGSYSYQSAKTSGRGTWQRSVKDNLVQYRFEGVLGHRKDDYGRSVIRSNRYGQWITLAEMSDKGEYNSCHQSGPSAEYARLQMASGLVDGQTWQCKFADGAIQSVQFANGRYQSQRGGGIYRSYALSDDGERWEGGLEFDGGPFANAQGKVKVNEYGQRGLALGVTVNKRRGYWYNADETTPVAQCFSDIQGRQYPEYGTGTVTASGVTGGPAGEYSVLQYNALNSGYDLKIHSFASNGWYLDEAPENRPIDCSRTKPSGEPYCLRYQLAPGKVKLQSSAGSWDRDEWQTLQRNPTNMVIDSLTYVKVKPLTGLKLSGTYKTQSSYSSGDIFNTLSTIQFQGEFVFTADGRFSTESGVFSRVGIGPGINNNNAVIGSSFASSTNGSSGRYRIDGNWLILTRDDGVEARKFIHLGGAPLQPNEKPEFLSIADSLYSLK